MTPERERLVRATEESIRAISTTDIRDPRFRECVRQDIEARNALAAYDAAHPEEAK